MKKLNVALVGFGSLGQSFARILLEKKEEIEKEYETTVNVVAITTKTRGNLVDAWGIDLARVLKNVEETGVFPNQHKTVLHKTSLEIAEAVDYDVLIEMTPLDMNEGQVATEHIMAALKRGKHVICANKGPLAWHYRELMELADENNCKLLFESTVMDGAPLFSLIRESLKMCEITEIRGILNSTTNYILQGIEQGKEMKDIVSESKKRGFIEANPKYDVEGTEAAAKLAALANAVMDADVTPDDVETTGIENVTKEMIDDAAARGNVIKLICFDFLFHFSERFCMFLSHQHSVIMVKSPTVTITLIPIIIYILISVLSGGKLNLSCV